MTLPRTTLGGGSLQRSRNPLIGGEGNIPFTRTPPSGPFELHSLGLSVSIEPHNVVDGLAPIKLVHGQVTIIFVVSVCLFVCLSVCAKFFSAVYDQSSIKLGHMLYVWV